MRWLVAFLLLVVVAGGVAVLVWDRPVRQALGLPTPPTAPAPAPDLDPDAVSKITLARGADSLTLTREAGKWTQPGGWPVREKEVADLLAAVGGIKSRYLPVSAADPAALGLADSQNPPRVTITAGGKDTIWRFGTAPDGAVYARRGDDPTAVRIAPDVLGVVARPPDTYRQRQLFSKPSRDKLALDTPPGQSPPALPSDRVTEVAVSGPDGTFTLTRQLPNPPARRTPAQPDIPPAVQLPELAEGWELLTPAGRDRPDPARLARALVVVPELWVDGFPRPDAVGTLAAAFFASPALPLSPPAVFRLANPEWEKDLAVQLTGFRKERVAELAPRHPAHAQLAAAFFAAPLPLAAGPILRQTDPQLEKRLTTSLADQTEARYPEARYPKERELTVTTSPFVSGPLAAVGGGPLAAANVGQRMTLRIGAVAKSDAAADPDPTEPPDPATRYHYAKLENNPLPFLVRADRLADLFTAPETLRDALAARYTAEEVQSVTLRIPRPAAGAAVAGGLLAAGYTPTPLEVVLTRKKGNEYAEREDDRKDRWKVGDRLAETDKVTELLNALSALDTKTPADRVAAVPDGFDPLGDFAVVVTAQTKVVDGDTPPPARTFHLSFTRQNAALKKLAVTVAGLPRVSLVDDGVLTVAEQGPPAYRSRRQFDTAEVTLTAFTVTKPDGTAYTLRNEAERGKPRWGFAPPISAAADRGKAARLAADLVNLEAVEYLDDAPTAARLAEYRLGNPAVADGLTQLAGGGPGLTGPRWAVALTFGGTGAKGDTLTIGAARPGTEEYFAKLASAPGVFSVSRTLVDALDGGPLSLLPAQLWAAGEGGVVSVSVARPGEAGHTVTREGAKWAVSGPFDAPASAADATQLAAALLSPRPRKYVALTPPPLAALAGGGAGGLMSALTVTVRVWVKGEDGAPDQVVERTLLVGGETAAPPPPPFQPGQPPPPPPSPGRFARYADGPDQSVFVLPADTFAQLEKPALDWLDRDLLKLDPAKVASVTAAEGVTLRYDAAARKWAAVGFASDDLLAGQLGFVATNPAVARIAAYGPKVNWAEYGLDSASKPLAVTLTTNDKTPRTHTILLGRELTANELPDDEPKSGKRYARIDGGPAVAVVNGGTASALARTRLALADRSLLVFKPDDVTALTRKKGAEELELASGIGWDVLKPTKFKADAETVAALLKDLAGRSAERVEAVAPTPDELKKYGLDAPTEIGVQAGNTTLVLRIGNPVDANAPNGDRFVRAGTDPAVKVLDGTFAARLLADPIKFKSKVLGDKFVDADKVTITRGDRKAVFAKVDGTWKMLEPAAAPAEQADLDALVTAAATLRADEIVSEKAADLKLSGLDKPTAEVRFFNGDKEVRAVLVGKKDGERVFGKLADADAVVLFGPELTARLLAEYRRRAVWDKIDAAQVQSVAVSAGDASFAFVRKDRWTDPAAPDDPPDPAKMVDVVSALATLKAERYAADKDADPKAFGLDKPSRVVTVSTPAGPRTLHLGAAVPGTDGKQVYAKVDDKARTDVFVLSAADTAVLTRDRPAYKK